MKEKNNFIEVLRFIFCLIIVIHHSQNMLPQGTATFFTSGALAVEFFYIITGYFSVKHVEVNKGFYSHMGESTKYTVKKLLRLLPYTAIAIIGAYVLEFHVNRNLPLIDRLMHFQNLPSELLMMPMTGQIEISLNSYRCAQLWFLSSMLIALPIVVYLAAKFNDVFKGYIVWFIPWILLGYMGMRWGSLFAWGSYGLILYGGTVRAFADLLLGAAVYYTANAVKEKNFKPNIFLKLFLGLCEICLLAFTLYSCHRSGLTVYDQIFVTMIIVIMLVISLSGISFSTKVFSGFLSPVWRFLGKISMPVFCLHWTVFKYLESDLIALPNYITSIITNIAVCTVIYLIITLISSLINKKKTS